MSSACLIFPAVVLGWPAAAFAADLTPLQIQAPSVVFSLVRVIGALALVFAVFLGGVWLFRNWQRLSVQKGRAPKLNVLEVRSLGPRHALYVIGYEQQRFLLSSAPTGITMLTSLPSAEGILEGLPARTQPNFTEILWKAVGRK